MTEETYSVATKDITYHPFIEDNERIHFPPLQDMFKIEAPVASHPSYSSSTVDSPVNHPLLPPSTPSCFDPRLTTSRRYSSSPSSATVFVPTEAQMFEGTNTNTDSPISPLDCTTNLFSPVTHHHHPLSSDRHENDYLDIDTIAFLRQENFFPSSSLDENDDEEYDRDYPMKNESNEYQSSSSPSTYSSPLLHPMNAMYDDRYALVRYYRSLRYHQRLGKNGKFPPSTTDQPVTMEELIDADIRKEEQLQAWWDGQTAALQSTTIDNRNNSSSSSSSSSRSCTTIESLLIFQKENNFVSSTTASVSHPRPSTVHYQDDGEEEEEEIIENDYFDLPCRQRYQSPFSSLPQVFSPVIPHEQKILPSSSSSSAVVSNDDQESLQPITKNLSLILDNEGTETPSLPLSLSFITKEYNSYPSSSEVSCESSDSSNIRPTEDEPNDKPLTTSSLGNIPSYPSSYHRDMAKLSMIRTHNVDPIDSTPPHPNYHDISTLPDLSLLNIQNYSSSRTHSPLKTVPLSSHDQEDIPLKLEHLQDIPTNNHSVVPRNTTKIFSSSSSSSYILTDPTDRSHRLYSSASLPYGLHSNNINSTKISDPVPLSPLLAQQYARIHAQLETLQRSYGATGSMK